MDFPTFIGAPLPTLRRARAPLPYAVDRRARPAQRMVQEEKKHDAHRHACTALEDRTPAPSVRVRTLSQESRAKISHALKGRRISPSHRSKISASLMGEKNPRYGRRLSAETRARIGAAVSAAGARRRAAAEAAAAAAAADFAPPQPSRKDGELPPRIRELRAKALSSPLLTGAPSRRPVAPGAEDAAVERLLDRVRAGAEPPESVARVRAAQRKREKGEQAARARKCAACTGAGTVRCAACVGNFGTISHRCPDCLGAGAVFCGACQGAGVCQ